MYVEQWKSNDYQDIKPVKLYLILNYPYKEAYLEYQMLETKMHQKFGDNFHVKIWNIQEKQTEEIKELYQKLFLVENEGELKTLEEDGRIQNVVKEMLEYNMDNFEYQKMKRSEKMYWTDEEIVKFHEATSREWWKKEGKEEGRKEGIQEGIREGIKEGKLEMLKNMIAENLDINTIIKISKLPKSEIEKYQKEYYKI